MRPFRRLSDRFTLVFEEGDAGPVPAG